MDNSEFIGKFEKIINEEIHLANPRYWDEDSITHSLLKKLEQEFHSLELEIEGENTLRIDWQSYKAKGTIENKLGDILLIVDYQDEENEHSLIGVSSLEAKRRYEGVGSFDAIKFVQLERITDNIPLSKLLLYDYEDNSNFHMALDLKTKIVTIPAKICTTLGKKNLSLYNFSLPLSLQFANRYFRALDLDFNENIIKKINEYINTKNQNGLFKFILTLHINKSGFFTGDRLGNIINIPPEKYERVVERAY